MDIIKACNDPKLFKPWFDKTATWDGWFAFLHTVFALPMGKEYERIYKECTQREVPPNRTPDEIWLVIGRRGGKSRILALIAIYLACFKDWRPFLSPGERATIVIIATDRRQSRVIFRYIEAFLKEVPMLKPLIERDTSEMFELKNQVNIEIHTASFRTIRGYTVAAALFDEMAFWRSEDAANPDREILAAIRPAMATIPDSMLLCASSPYARRGSLYETWKRYYGQENDRILVWQAPSWVMNPSLSQEWLDEEFEKDAASARAEYGAEFRSDVENFISEEALEAATPANRFELPYIPEFNYVAFTDPSGGSKDSFTLAISHYDEDKDKCILDAIREVQPPFSPEEVTKEFSETMQSYHISTVIGDRYGGEWPRERFREHGIEYEPADKVKSDVYREMLPLVNSGKVELLVHQRMVNQFLLLERRTRRGGKDSIDHPPNTHDDIANVVAGALVYSDQGGALEIW